MDGFSALRTHAFLMLGLASLVQADPGQGREAEILQNIAEGLAGNLCQRGEEGWCWFEDRLTYDNARLPEALIRSGLALSQPGLVQTGLEALDWLCRIQTGAGGVFRAIGASNFGSDFCVDHPFDQQPLEAAATVDACEAVRLGSLRLTACLLPSLGARLLGATLPYLMPALVDRVNRGAGWVFDPEQRIFAKGAAALAAELARARDEAQGEAQGALARAGEAEAQARAAREAGAAQAEQLSDLHWTFAEILGNSLKLLALARVRPRSVPSPPLLWNFLGIFGHC
jgi:hypothetical protein